MNLASLKPAKEFAQSFGMKSIIFGPPGSSKTPTVNTCPRPVLLATEPGLLSMRGSNVPTWLGYDVATIEEFFKWFFGSEETKNFDTIAVDSITQMPEIYLLEAQKNNKHGLKAYGEMATNTMKHLRALYYTKYKHTFLIAKEAVTNDENGFKMKRPHFPGQQLPVEIPHMYDAILHLAKHNVPSMGPTLSFQCHGTVDIMCRDRTGSLSEYEPPNFAALVAKAMS